MKSRSHNRLTAVGSTEVNRSGFDYASGSDAMIDSILKYKIDHISSTTGTRTTRVAPWLNGDRS